MVVKSVGRTRREVQFSRSRGSEMFHFAAG